MCLKVELSDMERRGQLNMILTIKGWKVQLLIGQRFLHRRPYSSSSSKVLPIHLLHQRLGFLNLIFVFSFIFYVF